MSKRQRECWDARSDLLSAKEVGLRLAISPHTVAMHWRLARLKLDVRDGKARPCSDSLPDDVEARPARAAIDPFGLLALLFLAFSALSVILLGAAWLTLEYAPAFEDLRQRSAQNLPSKPAAGPEEWQRH